MSTLTAAIRETIDELGPRLILGVDVINGVDDADVDGRVPDPREGDPGFDQDDVDAAPRAVTGGIDVADLYDMATRGHEHLLDAIRDALPEHLRADVHGAPAEWGTHAIIVAISPIVD